MSQTKINCPRMNELSPVAAVSIDPGVESRLWFLDQINASQPGFLGGLDRQFPCHFVERRRQRDHHVLLIRADRPDERDPTPQRR